MTPIPVLSAIWHTVRCASRMEEEGWGRSLGVALQELTSLDLRRVPAPSAEGHKSACAQQELQTEIPRTMASSLLLLPLNPPNSVLSGSHLPSSFKPMPLPLVCHSSAHIPAFLFSFHPLAREDHAYLCFHHSVALALFQFLRP